MAISTAMLNSVVGWLEHRDVVIGAGLLRDKTRPSRIPLLGAAIAAAWWLSRRLIRRPRPPTGPQP